MNHICQECKYEPTCDCCTCPHKDKCAETYGNCDGTSVDNQAAVIGTHHCLLSWDMNYTWKNRLLRLIGA